MFFLLFSAPPGGYQPPPTVILQPVPVRQVAPKYHQHPQTGYLALQPGGMLYSKATAVKPIQPSPPYSYLFENICVTLCCCPLIGIVGLYFSLRTLSLNSSGNYHNARDASKLAFLFGIVAVAVTMFIFFVCIIVFAIAEGRG